MGVAALGGPIRDCPPESTEVPRNARARLLPPQRVGGERRRTTLTAGGYRSGVARNRSGRT
jgi:hypothetical protein